MSSTVVGYVWTSQRESIECNINNFGLQYFLKNLSENIRKRQKTSENVRKRQLCHVSKSKNRQKDWFFLTFSDVTTPPLIL